MHVRLLFKSSNCIMSPVLLLLILPPLLFSNTIVASQSFIKTLPGFQGDLPFTLETGYIGVGRSEDVQLFYYFIQSERNPKSDPLMLWLIGGPGCSGLSSILYQIGPVTFNYANSTEDKPALELNPYSWTKVANIIFLDQPAGAGFSYAKTLEAYTTSDTLSASRSYDFLQKWFTNHPEFLDNPLYIGGDSYGGKIVPIVVQEIYNGNEARNEPAMNIKGYMVNSPLTDERIDYNSKIKFAHQVGLLSSRLYESTRKNCHEEYLKVDPDNILCANDLQAVGKCLDQIKVTHTLEQWCGARDARFSQLSSTQQRLCPKSVGLSPWDSSSFEENSGNQSSPIVPQPWCREDNYFWSQIWANDRSVQEALHVREGTVKEWLRCNRTISFTAGQEMASFYRFDVYSTVDYHKNLTAKNCRALIFSGDHDLVVPYLGTEEWIDSLNLPIENDWRPWFVEDQVAGFTVKYSQKDFQLTFATVKGSGHSAPEDHPKQSLHLVSRWFDHYPL